MQRTIEHPGLIFWIVTYISEDEQFTVWNLIINYLNQYPEMENSQHTWTEIRHLAERMNTLIKE